MTAIKNLDKIGISLSDFEEVKEGDKDYFILRKGLFGFTEKMKSKHNSKFYAIQKLDKKENYNKKSLFGETKIFIDLDHPNLIKFYGCFEDKEKIDKYKSICKDKASVLKTKKFTALF